MKQAETQIKQLRTVVLNYYKEFGRHDLPWRKFEADGTLDPYKILVSEVMLQQTQVMRVVPKYLEFLKLFPTVEALAATELSEVLRVWSGLGYNRRARFLWLSAQKIVTECNGRVPKTQEALVMLDGIGSNTAAAILAYSYNVPVVFIETNIRSVFLHHFFQGLKEVPDSSLLPLISDTLDTESVREWYWALMDYGSHLKKATVNPSRASKHHVVQSKFVGSDRQLRGEILRLLQHQTLTRNELTKLVPDSRLQSVLERLTKEHLITESSGIFSLG